MPDYPMVLCRPWTRKECVKAVCDFMRGGGSCDLEQDFIRYAHWSAGERRSGRARPNTGQIRVAVGDMSAIVEAVVAEFTRIDRVWVQETRFAGWAARPRRAGR